MRPGARPSEATDLTVLCLPDDAAREAAQWAAECGARLIDTSTAHRVADGWTYGLPELDATRREAIQEARFVANPGCYPSAFILLTRPLVDEGLLPHDAPVSIHALSGYSGGGRGLIEKWESPDQDLGSLPYEAPYALGARHKHVPEMLAYSGLTVEPQFVPAVGPFRCGMRVEVPIHLGMVPMGGTGTAMLDCLRERYDGEPFVRVVHHLPTRVKPTSAASTRGRATTPTSWNSTCCPTLPATPCWWRFSTTWARAPAAWPFRT